MKNSTSFFVGCALACLFAGACCAQSRNVALDSMGANMGRQNWKAAINWALQAAEANPAEKYWRYLNAADFASRDRNIDLVLHYTELVANSDIATNASFGKGFDWLRQDPRWIQLMSKIEKLRENQRVQLIQASLPFRHDQQELLTQSARHLDSLFTIESDSLLYKQIQASSPPHHYARTGRYQYAWLRLTDSLDFPYLVQLPANFNPRQRYPLVVVLHGAVGRQTALPDVADSTKSLSFFGHMFLEQASESGFIAVCPYSTRRYNWMMPDDGFELVPQIVRQVKKMYPIDDSRVYLTGHSNGATGAFSYLMKQPGLFAGFAGVNNRPQVRTGGTFLRNGINRSFYNVATDYDYYFPLEGHRAVTRLATQLNLDWQNMEVSGHRNHGYLIKAKDSTTVEVYRQLFNYLMTKQRNPFRARLFWECDDVKNGRCDWLELNELDTLASKKDWHTSPNTLISGWLNVDNPEIGLDSSSQAFVFPRRSGAVEASYSNNQFELKTSRVKSVTLYLSPEMIDFNHPIKVVINGRVVYNGRIKTDRSFLAAEFTRELDQQAVWTNRFHFSVP